MLTGDVGGGAGVTIDRTFSTTFALVY